jgi:uncharacterized protein involved in exopolysaccharide biosynthesis
MKKQTTQANPEAEMDLCSQVSEDEINLLSVLLVLAKYKKMIVVTCIAIFLLSCGVTLLMPNIYTATIRILPPDQDNNRLSNVLGAVSGIASLVGVSGRGSSADLYVGMLHSRTIADAVIDRFHLQEAYQSKTRQGTYDALSQRVNIELGKKDNIIAISVEDEEPERSAAIANTFVEELKRLTVGLNLSDIERERSFLDARLVEVHKDLETAENHLRDFQKEHDAIRLDDQATAMIDAIAKLKGELTSREILVSAMLTSRTKRNPEVQAVLEEISQIKKQMLKLGSSSSSDPAARDIFFPTTEVPDLQVQYGRLLRDLKIQEALFELLTKQDEMAKINQAREVSSLQVLDRAVPPDRKSRPRRSLLVLGVTGLAFVLSVLLAFALESAQRMSPAQRKRWQEIGSLLRFK